MNLQVLQTSIPGCFELIPFISKDLRGRFVKTFNKDTFFENKLETNFVEEYYSFSLKRVLRGLHFQTPPYGCVKLVYCISGKVLDVVVDLRIGSPTYGKFEAFHLNEEKANMIYIPEGAAHGFYVESQSAILAYKTNKVYSPDHDDGIFWNSVGISWPDDFPIVSERDSKFVTFSEFKSPFKF